jgi:hypothetical protein
MKLLALKFEFESFAATVPEVGRVNDVVALTVNVIPKLPDIVSVEAALLATPVPPKPGGIRPLAADV